MTGSIGVVTINMARIGYNHKDDIDGFKTQVRSLMDLAKESLEIKRTTLTTWLK
jgi:ribonucleoside-triphosphate reductase